MLILSYLFFARFLLSKQDQVQQFNNHKLVEFVNNESVNIYLNSINADIWKETEDFIQAQLSPMDLKKFKSNKDLQSSGNITVLVDNIQETIDSAQGPSNRTDWFCDYRTHDEIKDWYINHSKLNEGSVKFVNSIGKTYKGRDIFAVHLTNPVNYGPPKKKVWLQSLIHAREWISGSTTQYIFNYLLENKDSNPQVKKLLNDIEIIFIPIVNIDGYIYTHTVNRLQRKNLNFEAGGNGVDLNRNYPYHWGGEGASSDPNHYSYRGSCPASEPETQAIISYYNKTGPFDGTIDFHSYGQLVLRPYTDNNRDSPTEAEHKKLGDGIRDSIQSVRGTSYISQKFIDMYAGAGAMTDWTCGDQCKTYSYLIELSPQNEGQDLQGFILPPSDILPVGNETIKGVLYFLDYLNKNPLRKPEY